MADNIQRHQARCPICGELYKYTADYKPATCNKFECLYAYLHPALRKIHRDKETK